MEVCRGEFSGDDNGFATCEQCGARKHWSDVDGAPHAKQRVTEDFEWQQRQTLAWQCHELSKAWRNLMRVILKELASLLAKADRLLRRFL